MKEDIPEEFLSLRQCSKYGKVTRQAIYVAIRKKNLVAVKKKGNWCIKREDYDAYRLDKYNRDKRIYDNELIFDAEKGHFSVPQTVKIISDTLRRPYSAQHIYYLLRTGQLKGIRKGGAWVISKEDGIDLLEKEMGHDNRQLELGV